MFLQGSRKKISTYFQRKGIVNTALCFATYRYAEKICDKIFPQKATLKRHIKKEKENPLMSAITQKNQKKLHQAIKFNKIKH